MPTYIGNCFTLTFRKFENVWLISDIHSDYDQTYQKYKHTAFDQAEYTADLIRCYQKACENTIDSFPDSETFEALSTPNCITNTYSRTQAAAYANIYSKTNDNTCYNSNFEFVAGSDCANFVSQCIWAGFGGDNTRAGASDTSYPYDFTGTSSSTRWNRLYSGSNYGGGSWYGAVSLYNYAVASNASATEYGWKSITGNAWNDSASSNQFPSSYNYHGAAFFVRGSEDGAHPEYGHAIFINSAYGNHPSNMYYCAHTNATNNALLSENEWYMSHKIRYVIPTEYKIPVVCTGSYTTHSYPSASSGYSATCQRCGYINMYMSLKWAKYAPNSTVTIQVSELRSNAPYSIVAQVYSSTGINPIATFTASNSASLTATTNSMAATGLYRVVVTVRDKAPAESGAIVRQYEYNIRVGD